MSEKDEIKKMGGRAQKNSGRGMYQKGDAKLGPFVVDIKEYGKTFGVSKTVWSKLQTDANRSNGEPALMLALGNSPTLRLWVIDDIMFHQMLDAWREKYE